MTRTRVWSLTALVTLALVINLGLLSSRAARKADSNVRGRLAAATKALRAQLELADTRATPRVAAHAPQLVEALRPPEDPTLPSPKPDERALRATAAVFEGGGPDLLLVANADGAALSRKGKPAAILPDLAQLAPVKGMLEGGPLGPGFLSYDGQLFRVHGARIPGGAGLVLTGQQITDALASSLRASIDADVTFLKEGAVAASSLDGAVRTQLADWAKLPGLGFGVLRLQLPLLGGAFDGTLPLGSDHLAIRTSNVAFESGVTAVVSVDAAGQLAWLGRYEAFYLGLLFFLALAGLALGNVRDPEPPRVVSVTRPATAPVRPRGESKPELKALPKADPKPTTEELVTKPPPVEAPKAPVELQAVRSPLPPLEAPPLAAASSGGHPAGPKSPEVAAAPAVQPDGPIALPGPHGDLPAPGARQEDAKDAPADAALAPSPPEERPDSLLNQPTRIEPVSQELLQKLRERDEEEAAAAPAEPAAPPVAAPAAPSIDPWAVALAPSPAAPVAAESADAAPELPKPPAADDLVVAPTQAPPGEPLEAGSVAVSLPPPVAGEAAPASPPAEAEAAGAALQPATAPAGDPDEPHFLDTFRKFVELRQQTGEPADRVSYEKFVAKLKKNREDLIAKHSAKGVRFSVYVKDGKASIKASAIR